MKIFLLSYYVKLISFSSLTKKIIDIYKAFKAFIKPLN